MSQYSDATEAITAMAQVKMVMNRHKGNIEDLRAESILHALRDEIDELQSAVYGDDLIHIIEEAADVHNFLIAVVQQQILKYRGRKNVNNK